MNADTGSDERHLARFLYRYQDDRAGSAAIKALYRGEATPEQQKLALQAIRQGICKFDELQYDPHSERNTAFALGMKFVAHQIAKVCTLDEGRLQRAYDYAAMSHRDTAGNRQED